MEDIGFFKDFPLGFFSAFQISLCILHISLYQICAVQGFTKSLKLNLKLEKGQQTNFSRWCKFENTCFFFRCFTVLKVKQMHMQFILIGTEN